MAVCACAAGATPPASTVAKSAVLIAFEIIGFPPGLILIAVKRISVPLFRFLLSQRFPYMGAQMDKGFQVHHVLDPLELIPVFRLSDRPDVDDFLDPAGPPRHYNDAIGEGDGFLDRMGDEQYRARSD